MNEINYQGVLIRINSDDNNIVESSKDNGKSWDVAYKEDTFKDFSDLRIDGLRVYATSNRGSVWSSNFGNSWHI